MGSVDYKNGAKNQWRRTLWNAIARRAKRGIVLYLPGPQNLDYQEAVRRGFRPADLIAVERDANLAAALRERGVTTINASLLEVVFWWPEGQSVSAVVADLQCGFDEWVIDLVETIEVNPAFDDCVLALNLQRGRDPQACGWRDVLEESGASVGANRARLVAASCGLDLWSLLAGTPQDLEFLTSYRSSKRGALFDALVARRPGLSRRASRALGLQHLLERAISDVSPLVSAALAIRTRRLRGELGGGVYRPG